MVGGDPYCCELLLHDHAQLGCVDENGWQEIHQVSLTTARTDTHASTLADGHTLTDTLTD